MEIKEDDIKYTMNMWKRFLVNTPDHKKQDLAFLLENQKLQNKCQLDKDINPTWARISIPLCIVVFNLLDHEKYDIISDFSEEAKTAILDKGFWNKSIEEKFRSFKFHSIDEESENIQKLATKIVKSLHFLFDFINQEKQKQHQFTLLCFQEENGYVYVYYNTKVKE